MIERAFRPVKDGPVDLGQRAGYLGSMSFRMSLSVRLFPAFLLVSCARIQPGVPWVARVDIQGNEEVRASLVKNAMATRASSRWPWGRKYAFEPAVFRADQVRVVELYRLMGYRKAEVVASSLEDLGPGEGLRVTLTLHEGPRTTVDETYWQGLPPLSVSARHTLLEQSRLREGEPHIAGLVLQEQRKALDILAEEGYPLAKVATAEEWSQDSLRVSVGFTVQPGPLCRFGPTSFDGVQRLRVRDLQRNQTYREGALFRRSKLRDTRQQLYSQGLVKYVAVSLADAPDSLGSLPVTFRIREASQRYLKAAVGFGSQDRVRGALTLGHRNLLGGARNLELALRASWWRQEAAVRLRQPQWPWPRHTLGAAAYLRWEQEKSYEVRVQGSGVDLARSSGRYTRASVSYSIERITFYGDTEEVKEEMGDAYRNPSVLATIQTAISRDSRAEPFWPGSGSASRLTVEAPGLFWKSDYRYIKVWLEWSRFRRVWREAVLAGRIGVGTIKTQKSGHVVPVQRRFYCGGTHSVRGFGRRSIGPKDAEGSPVGGQTLGEGSLEIRFPVHPSVGGVVFGDVGGVWKDYLEARRAGMEWSCGVGVRVSSPVGPLSADLAWDVSRPLSRHAVRLHVMVGQAF
jgi:outer membrane protein assembly complex protein YaeT